MVGTAFKYVPQPEVTTFAFPSVFILLLCLSLTDFTGAFKQTKKYLGVLLIQ